jgi:hypothetical protein
MVYEFLFFSEYRLGRRAILGQSLGTNFAGEKWEDLRNVARGVLKRRPRIVGGDSATLGAVSHERGRTKPAHGLTRKDCFGAPTPSCLQLTVAPRFVAVATVTQFAKLEDTCKFDAAPTPLEPADHTPPFTKSAVARGAIRTRSKTPPAAAHPAAREPPPTAARPHRYIRSPADS